MSVSSRGRRLVGAVTATLATVLMLTVAPPLATATNPETIPGDLTVGCAVDWRAVSDLSHSYTKDYDGNGTIESGEQYSNRGYIQEVTSRDTYPAVQGPGELILHHWTNSATALGFRLPVATDYTMYDVTVRIAPQSTNFTLDSTVTALGLAKYVAIDGNPAYLLEAPAPTVTTDAGAIILHWDVIPAGSANIYAFGGTATDGAALDPASHYLIGAKLTASYAEGSGCPVTAPPVPTAPTEGPCEQVLTGRTLMPVGAPDITERPKWGDGGEVNADGWGSGDTRTFRLYGATTNDLTDVTFTATAAQGFTFSPSSSFTIVTGSPTGMGALYANGFTVAATGFGTPTLSADGKTLTLTIASMPANSAFIILMTATLDGSMKQLVIDEQMVGTLADCTVPQPSIDLEKSAGAVVDVDHNGADAGDTIAYEFLVTNTSTLDLTEVAVSDPKVGAVTCPATTLAAGAHMTCTATYVLKAEDVDAGEVTNVATASGTHNGVTVTDKDTVVTPVEVDVEASISLDKVADATGPVEVGDTITYTFVVTNTGTITLTGLEVLDSMLDDAVTCPVTSLEPGDSTTCTAAPYTVTDDDAEVGSVDNQAVATGDACVAGDECITVEDDDIVTVEVVEVISGGSGSENGGSGNGGSSGTGGGSLAATGATVLGWMPYAAGTLVLLGLGGVLIGRRRTEH